jgi:hypothetical protein
LEKISLHIFQISLYLFTNSFAYSFVRKKQILLVLSIGDFLYLLYIYI